MLAGNVISGKASSKSFDAARYNRMNDSGFSNEGMMRCSLYAFGPNRLHYCGPDASAEVAAHIKEGVADPGLEALLKRFETLYPYLVHIAGENGIRDPFDERVVEAYWLGNELLGHIEQGHFYRHLKDGLSMKKKIGAEAFESGVAEKIRHGGLPHHSFHVLNVWKGMGEKMLEGIHDVAECLVSLGTVTEIDGPWITLTTDRLTFDGKALSLVSETRKLPRPFDASEEWDFLALGDFVSFHWGVLCEKISERQAQSLKSYTEKSISLANRGISNFQ
jgi:hypothetical protein